MEIEQNIRETEEIRVWSSFEVEGGSRVSNHEQKVAEVFPDNCIDCA